MKRTRFASGTILAAIFTMFVGPSTVQLFAQDGTWTTKTSSPSPRRNVGVAVLNGMVYAVGGAPPGSTSSIATLEAYNPLTDSWTTKASMPVASQELTAGVIDGKLYAVGGGTCCGAIATLQAYDPVTDSWSIKTSMPTPRYGPDASVVNGILYVVGGGSGYGTLYSNLEAYDPTTDLWTEKAAIPTGRGALGLASVNGILYAIGGEGFGPPLATVEAYDPASDTWTTKASMPTPRVLLTASVVNGIIYAIGGSNGSGNVATVEAYDPATDTWTEVSPMPAAVYWPGSGVVNGVVYTLGPVGDSDLMVQAFTPTSQNQPPLANSGPDKTQECANPAGTLVTLDGSASTDPDGDTLTYTWTGPFAEGGGTVTGVKPAVTLPLGTSTITLVVNDGTVDSAPDTVKIDIQVFVSGLQPPMVGLSTEAVPPLLPTRAFKLGSTIPIKLQLFCSGVVCTNPTIAPPRIVALFASGGPIDLATVDINSGAANDNGVYFRFSDPSWVYNLSTQGLSAGTYTITIQMPDGRRFNAGFVLR